MKKLGKKQIKKLTVLLWNNFKLIELSAWQISKERKKLTVKTDYYPKAYTIKFDNHNKNKVVS